MFPRLLCLAAPWYLVINVWQCTTTTNQFQMVRSRMKSKEEWHDITLSMQSFQVHCRHLGNKVGSAPFKYYTVPYMHKLRNRADCIVWSWRPSSLRSLQQKPTVSKLKCVKLQECSPRCSHHSLRNTDSCIITAAHPLPCHRLIWMFPDISFTMKESTDSFGRRCWRGLGLLPTWWECCCASR